MIQWISPLTNRPVFTWHENSNYENGAHYHINDIDKGVKSKFHKHFYAYETIPEPYASVYFLGGYN